MREGRATERQEWQSERELLKAEASSATMKWKALQDEMEDISSKN